MHSKRPALLALCVLLGACSPTTPLFIAQVTTNEVVEYKAMKSKRIAAAVEEEGDLLTYSAMAIRDAKSPEAEALYLVGYHDDDFSDDIRAIALYQVGLIYMSRYNEQRDDTRALAYLERVLDEFPASRAAERAETRILTIRQRARGPVQKSAQELLASWQQSASLDLYQPGLDSDMTLLSRRAVLKDRVAEAEELYLLALSDAHVQPDIKEKALYQLGLMYLAPDNPQANRDKAIGYLRRLLVQFPASDLSGKASRHLDQALNQDRP
ncbi:hypothetical protein FQZ97_864620 [compost metagenome]